MPAIKYLKSIVFAASFALLLSTNGHTAHADQTEDAVKFVERLAEEVISVIRTADIDDDHRLQRYQSIFDHAIDIDLVAQIAIGRHWHKLSPVELDRYKRSFRTYITRIYSRRFGGQNGARLEIVNGLSTTPTDTIVYAQIEGRDISPVETAFRVRKKDDLLRIVDVSVNGISLVLTKRSEFNSVVYNKGVSELLSILEGNSSNPVNKENIIKGL